MMQRTKDLIGKAVLETLEDRRLFSAISYADGVLGVVGDAGDTNLLTVTKHSGNRHLVVSRNGIVTYHKIWQVDRLMLVGGDQDDTIYVAPDVTASVNVVSGAGTDAIYAGDGTSNLGDDGDRVGTAEIGASLLDNDGALLAGHNRPMVLSFSLINADTDEVIATYDQLGNGVTLNLATLPTRNINIRANASDANSVHFSVTGRMDIEHTDNGAPFALAGSDGNDYWGWNPRTGTYTMTVTPFGGANARGQGGIAKSLTFTIVDQPPVQDPTPTEEPAPTEEPPPVEDPTDTTEPPIVDPPPPTTDPAPLPDDDQPGDVVDLEAPVPVISVLDATTPAGHAMHFSALESELVSGDIINAVFEWDFGDSGGRYNTLRGWTAAHSYDAAGTYTVTLRVTNAAGKTASVQKQITVTPANRTIIYVSNDGNDANSGLSPDQAIRTFAQASWLVNDNTEIRFRRGDSFTVVDGMSLGHENVVIGAYGQGERPVMNLVTTTGFASVFYTSNGHHVTISGLTFEAPNADSHVISVGGRNVTVRDSQFLHMTYAMNLNPSPTGVLIQDNVAPLVDGIKGYFVWSNGTDISVLGNTVANTASHVIRLGVTHRMLLAHNNLTNPVEASGYRGTLTIQTGSHIYIANNTLNDGVFAIGPLPDADGLRHKETRMQWVVAENNVVNSRLIVEHGAEHIMLRNNVVNRDGGVAIEVAGYNSDFGRGVVDLHVLNNTATIGGAYGNFIKVGGAVDGIEMRHNLLYAPNLIVGDYRSAPVRVMGTDLSSFTAISDNIWPMPTMKSYTGGGINWVGYDANSTTYQTTTEWEAWNEVEGDLFQDVTLDLTYQVSIGDVTAGAELQRAA